MDIKKKGFLPRSGLWWKANALHLVIVYLMSRGSGIMLKVMQSKL